MGTLKSINQAIITVGGKGTRLKEVTKNIPKPLWLLNGTSTLERAVINVSSQGINNIILLCGFNANFFRVEIRKFEVKYKVKFKIYEEKEVLGEAGAIFKIIESLEDVFLFINGDIVFDLDFKRLFKYYEDLSADLVFITHTSSHPEDSDCVIEDTSNRILKYKFKNDHNKKNFFLGNAGVSLLSKKVILKLKELNFDKKKELSFFKDVIIKAHNFGLKVFSYNTSEYLKDMGTKERLIKVEQDIKNLLPSKLSYRNKQSALFLDRDDTLIECGRDNYITNINNVRLLDANIKKLKEISKKFNMVVVITNQPQISRGLCSFDLVNEINSKVAQLCLEKGLLINYFYICPHHPHNGFKNEIKSLKMRCFCRKPNPGMILQASFERNIDLSISKFIGDSWRDQKASESISLNFENINSIS